LYERYGLVHRQGFRLNTTLVLDADLGEEEKIVTQSSATGKQSTVCKYVSCIQWWYKE